MKPGGALRKQPGANPYTTFKTVGTPLVTRKPLAPGGQLARTGSSRSARSSLTASSPGRRGAAARKPLKARSEKTARVYREERVPLTVDMLAENDGQCGIRWDQRCRGQADALHELLSRGRGGSITDRANCVPACDPCNEAVSAHPVEAEARGFLLPSGRPSKATPRRAEATRA